MAEPLSSPFHVGDWLAEPSWHRIRRDGESVKLEPRVMRLLATLAAAPGRPLLRRELLDTVWPDVLVNEEALSRAVSQLRRALGDDPRAPRYVQTVHKGGYCLVAPVTDAPAGASAPPEPTATSRGRRAVWPPLLLFFIGIAGALFYRGLIDAPQPQVPRQLVPITSEPGREIDPAVSPDGSRIAYLASTATGYELFVRGIDGGAPVRLTRSVLTKGHPAWAPDGDRIAFVGAEGDAAAIYVVPSAGGAAAKLVDLPSWSYGLDWSPDGRTLAYSDAAPDEAAGIVLLDVASKAARPLARSAGSAGDVKPMFAPDGKRVAFIRTDPLERQQVVVVDVEGRAVARALALPPQQLRGLDWAPGGEAVIVSARTGRRFGLWRVPTDGSAPTALAVDGGDLYNPSVSVRGRIVVEEVAHDRDIWLATLSGGPAHPLIQSTHDDYDPAFAPGGTGVAFVSERSGAPEIWLQPTRGEPRQLTSLSGPDLGHIAWSPDGTRIAFRAEADGASAIYMLRFPDGRPERLPGPTSAEIPIGWSSAGDGLFLLALAEGRWRLELLTLADRRRRSIADIELRLAAVAPDGSAVFGVPAGEDKLLRIVPGRGVVRQFRLPPLARLVALLPARDAVHLVEDAAGTARVQRLDLATGGAAAGIRLDDHRDGGFSLAADGRSLAYTRARETANDLAWVQL